MKWIVVLMLLPAIVFSDTGYVNNGNICVSGSPQFVRFVKKCYAEYKDMKPYFSIYSQSYIRPYLIVANKKLKFIIAQYNLKTKNGILVNGMFQPGEDDTIWIREELSYTETMRVIFHESLHFTIHLNSKKAMDNDLEEALVEALEYEMFMSYYASQCATPIY